MELFFTNPGLHVIGESILQHLDCPTLLNLHNVFDCKCLYTPLHQPLFWYDRFIYKKCAPKIQYFWRHLIFLIEDLFDLEQIPDLERPLVSLMMQVLKDSEDSIDTPLNCAAKYGFFEIIQFMTEDPEDALLREQFNTFEFGTTPIHEAAKFNHPEVVKLLLPFAEDDNAKDEGGNTPFDLAWSNENLKIVEILLNCNRNKRFLI